MKYQTERRLHILESCGINLTLQEVWNKTVGLEQEERFSNGKRTKAYNNMDCVANCCR